MVLKGSPRGSRTLTSDVRAAHAQSAPHSSRIPSTYSVQTGKERYEDGAHSRPVRRPARRSELVASWG
jgi:hypothetical protein